MNRDRRDEISDLYHRALVHPPEERRTFLKNACAGDEGLLQEIESLLACESASVRFLESPAAAVSATGFLKADVVGRQLGAYQILGPLGAGGMGEVYRARDTELGRDVAIKILPPHFTADSERRARFRREARTLATLSHPNIAAIYGFEHADGLDALVLELIEGPTLAERLERGPLPISEGLTIARQIAEALEAAHDKGIVHRDLKPANIVLQETGGVPRVKVLDFGLAKAMAPDLASGLSGSFDGTADGRILGTPAYMSPEQARGLAVDKRTDIWSFGCVLFEMLTGRLAFEGQTATDTFGRILEHAPEWSALPAETPSAIRTLLGRCLQKDPKRRLRDIADIGLEIEDAIAGRVDGVPVRQTADVARHHRTRWIALAAALFVAAAVGVGVIVWQVAVPAPQVTRAMLDVRPADEVGTSSVLGMLPGGSRTALAWSPNGRTLAFVGSSAGVRRVYLRDLDSETARPLDGTDGARSFTFSPDGRSIAFWAAGAIRKISVAGGPPAKICDVAQVSGISWGPRRIVYTSGRQLFGVSSDGGEPLSLIQSKLRLSSPFLLPGEAGVLYTEFDSLWTSGDERVIVQSLAPGAPPKVLVQEAADARYLTTGHLAFIRQGTVFVVPFSSESLEVRGDEVAVLNGVAHVVATWASNDLTLTGQFAISPQGTLAYVDSPTPSLPTSELVSLDRTGHVTLLGAPANSYRDRVESSPEGTSVAVPLQTAKNVRLYRYDLTRKTLALLAAESSDREVFAPIWSADGKIAISVGDGDAVRLAVFRSDAAAPPETVSDSEGFVASSWSHDGERLVGSKAGDLWVYSSTGGGLKWTQVTQTPSAEQYPVWSPNGRWLAYTSYATGRSEVYVRAYPSPGIGIPVSTNTGRSLAWNSNGRELFYVEGDPLQDDTLRMMSVDMENPLRPGRAVALFSFSPANLLLGTCSPTACYSVAPSGREFFTLRMLPREPARVTRIRIVFNWFEERKRLVPE